MKKLKQFVVNHLQFVAKRIPFNYERYWKERYDKYGFNILYSGKKGLSVQENKISYQRKIQIFFNLIKKYGITKDSLILDIGCGFGMLPRNLKEAGYKNYTGIDLNENIINNLNNHFHNGFKFEQMDVSKEKIEGSYDFIFMINVTQHIIKDKDFEFIMSNIKTSLNSEGYLLVNDMDRDSRDAIYIRRRKLDYYKKVLNFELIDTIDIINNKLFVFRK